MCLDDFNGQVGRNIDRFDEIHGGYGICKKNLERSILLELCLKKVLYISNIWLKRENKNKVTFRMGENEKKIDFELIKKTGGLHKM